VLHYSLFTLLQIVNNPVTDSIPQPVPTKAPEQSYAVTDILNIEGEKKDKEVCIHITICTYVAFYSSK